MGSEGAMEHILASELYPKKTMECDAEGLVVPFPMLCGECVLNLGRTSHGTIALSNFRIFIHCASSIANVPLGLIDTIESRDIFHLYLYCKDGRMFRCVFDTNEACLLWYQRLSRALDRVDRLQDVFAFTFHAWCLDAGTLSTTTHEPDTGYELMQTVDAAVYSFGKEVERMGFDLKNTWRISYVNETFRSCSSYPQLHIVPQSVTDGDLEEVIKFRSSRRFPSVVWRDTRTGAVIARCSQPEVGWLGWRNNHDEQLMLAISKACMLNPGSATAQSAKGEGSEDEKSGNGPELLIVDARSYTAAVANRTKGGGCECEEYYSHCDIQFMNLANIHSIRKSFQAMRTLCSSAPDQISWLSALEGTKWLQHISSLLKASVVMVNAVEKEGRPILVHCSDGWDRTPQLVALAELLLDPYYRTMQGFATMVEREWVEFGHKFADRCGVGKCADDSNERCPIFLQFLDCVYQLLLQFPCAFQFNSAFLVKLVQHTYSCLFGNFLCNTSRERQKEKTLQQTLSVWTLLKHGNQKFKNYSYTPSLQALRPSYSSRHLVFWSAVYLSDHTPTLQPAEQDQVDQIETSSETSEADLAGRPQSLPPKTRSCDDLVAAVVEENSSNTRRLSDPSIAAIDPQLLLSSDTTVNSGQVADADMEEKESGTKVILNGEAEIPSCAQMNGNQITDVETTENGIVPRPDDENEENGDVEQTENLCENESVSGTSDTNTSQDDAQSTDNGIDHALLESKPFEGSTDTLTGDLAQLHSAKSSEQDIQDKIDRTRLSAEDERDIRTLTTRTTVSTSTTDISDSSVTLKEAVVQTSSGGRVVCVPLEDGFLDNQVIEVIVREPATLQQTAAQVVGVIRGNSNGSSTESESHTPLSTLSRTPNSTSPPTPSASKGAPSWPNGKANSVWSTLDVDGLVTWMEPGQKRLIQMEAEYLHRTEQLQNELKHTQMHLTRLVMKQNGGNGANLASLDPKEDLELASLESGGERSSVEGSDFSWEAVEEGDAQMTLWVPDHAVTHCADCHKEFFWMVRRKHHCRNCGRVYCSDCTANKTSVPQQQLNEPVRVCNNCFSVLTPEDMGNVRRVDTDASIGSYTLQAGDLEAAMMDDDSSPDTLSKTDSS